MPRRTPGRRTLRAALGSWSGRVLLIVLIVVPVIIVVGYRVLRRRPASTSLQGWPEGICPACLALRAGLRGRGDDG